MRSTFEQELAASQSRSAALQSALDDARQQLSSNSVTVSGAKAAHHSLQSRLEDALREVQREKDTSHSVVVSERACQAKLQALQLKLDDASEALLSAEAARATDQKAINQEKSKRCAAGLHCINSVGAVMHVLARHGVAVRVRPFGKASLFVLSAIHGFY